MDERKNEASSRPATGNSKPSALMARPLGWPDEPHADAFFGLAGDVMGVTS